MIKLLHEYGADLDAVSAKDWTPLSYCKAKGKYGATEEKGIYPEVGGGRGRMGVTGLVRVEQSDEARGHLEFGRVTRRGGTWSSGGWGAARLLLALLATPATPDPLPLKPAGRAALLWRHQVRQRAARAGRALAPGVVRPAGRGVPSGAWQLPEPPRAPLIAVSLPVCASGARPAQGLCCSVAAACGAAAALRCEGRPPTADMASTEHSLPIVRPACYSSLLLAAHVICLTCVISARLSRLCSSF